MTPITDAFAPPHPRDIPAMALDLELRALEGQTP
jgi:hypothetical protein